MVIYLLPENAFVCLGFELIDTNQSEAFTQYSATIELSGNKIGLSVMNIYNVFISVIYIVFL